MNLPALILEMHITSHGLVYTMLVVAAGWGGIVFCLSQNVSTRLGIFSFIFIASFQLWYFEAGVGRLEVLLTY